MTWGSQFVLHKIRFFQYFKLAGGRTGRSPDENHYIFGRLVPVDHLKGLEQAAISKRAERLKEYKEYIKDLPEKDAKRILKELAILEKIRAQK